MVPLSSAFLCFPPVHYAGTDRRLDKWIDTERIDLSSVRLSLPPEQCEAHIVTRDAADQKFSEILQRNEKNMVCRRVLV